MPGITFHGIRTPSWDSRSTNSFIFFLRLREAQRDEDSAVILGTGWLRKPVRDFECFATVGQGQKGPFQYHMELFTILLLLF